MKYPFCNCNSCKDIYLSMSQSWLELWKFPITQFKSNFVFLSDDFELRKTLFSEKSAQPISIPLLFYASPPTCISPSDLKLCIMHGQANLSLNDWQTQLTQIEKCLYLYHLSKFLIFVLITDYTSGNSHI